MDEEEDVFINYSAMNRPAVFFGVPLMIFLGMSMITILLGFPLMMFFGMNSIPFFIILIGVFFYVKNITATDPNALKNLKWKMKGFFLRSNKNILVFKEDFSYSGKKENERNFKKCIHKRFK